MPPLEVWIKAKKHYPIGTEIEREFPKDSGLIYDATVTDIDLEKPDINLSRKIRINIQRGKTAMPVANRNIYTLKRNVKIQSWRDN